MSSTGSGPVAVSAALAEAVGRVGDRWALLVVNALLAGPRRFNDLADDVPGIATSILAQRLRSLEQVGVVVASPYSRRPPRHVYELTAAGQELAGALRLLAQWGSARVDGTSGAAIEPLRHSGCGSPLEARWYCPTCESVVDDVDASSADPHQEVRWL